MFILPCIWSVYGFMPLESDGRGVFLIRVRSIFGYFGGATFNSGARRQWNFDDRRSSMTVKVIRGALPLARWRRSPISVFNTSRSTHDNVFIRSHRCCMHRKKNTELFVLSLLHGPRKTSDWPRLSSSSSKTLVHPNHLEQIRFQLDFPQNSYWYFFRKFKNIKSQRKEHSEPANIFVLQCGIVSFSSFFFCSSFADPCDSRQSLRTFRLRKDRKYQQKSTVMRNTRLSRCLPSSSSKPTACCQASQTDQSLTVFRETSFLSALAKLDTVKNWTENLVQMRSTVAHKESTGQTREYLGQNTVRGIPKELVHRIGTMHSDRLDTDTTRCSCVFSPSRFLIWHVI